jgi:hypothetical protein
VQKTALILTYARKIFLIDIGAKTICQLADQRLIAMNTAPSQNGLSTMDRGLKKPFAIPPSIAYIYG